MLQLRRLVHLSSVIALLCVCLLVVGLLPTQPVAATRVNRVLDTILEDFSPGNFVRSSLVQTIGTNIERDAAVQLALMGAVRPMLQAPNMRLPKRLSRMGAVVLGKRIYILGGQTPGPSGTEIPTDEVWSGLVNLPPAPDGTRLPRGDTLAESGWRAELSLPATIGTRSNEPITATYAVAATAVDNPTGNDYIYIFGGVGRYSVTDAQDLVAHYSVRIAEVNPDDGRITRWQTSDIEVTGADNTFPMRIPDGNPDIPSARGIYAAMAATVRVNDIPYVYLVGGVERRIEGGGTGIIETGSRRAFYARVGAEGLLYRPDTVDDALANLGWNEQLPLLPERPDQDGVWDGAMAAVQLGPDAVALYVIGGQVRNETQVIPQTTAIYRGLVAADGRVSWEDGWSGTMQTPVSSHAAVEFDGSIFVTGGRENRPDNILDTALASYVEDRMELHNFADETPDPNDSYNFDISEANPAALPIARAFHGSVVVQYKPDERVEGPAPVAYIYVLGGFGPNAIGERTSADEVFVLRVSNQSIDNPVFVRRGSYTSRVHAIDLGSPKIEAINWTTTITRPTESNATDVQLEYRRSGSQDCNAPVWDDEQENQGWKELDALPEQLTFSQTGIDTTNTVTFTVSITQTEVEVARCFQYRAFFTTTDENSSPQLKEVSIRIFTPDSPDLKVSKLEPDWVNQSEGKIRGILVDILNKYDPPPGEPQRPTLNADVESAGVFFVDFFVVGPGQNPQVVTPTLPLTSTIYVSGSLTFRSTLTASSDALSYMGVDKSLLPENATYSIRQWCDAQVEDRCQPVDFASIFQQAGDYTFCVAVDSYVQPAAIGEWPRGFVNETLPGGEENNFTCAGPFPISEFEPPPPPTVTLELASSATITENVGMGDFRLRRVGDASKTITVSLSLASTATINTDYTLTILPSTPITQTGTLQVVMPAGVDSLTLQVTAVRDWLVERDETVDVQLLARDDTAYKAVATSVQLTIDNEVRPMFLPVVQR